MRARQKGQKLLRRQLRRLARGAVCPARVVGVGLRVGLGWAGVDRRAGMCVCVRGRLLIGVHVCECVCERARA
eukprot:1886980-Pleurochrysis_carterae.AAC.1